MHVSSKVKDENEKQGAAEAHSSALQTHFVRMATEWSSLADQGPNANTQTERGYSD
jgi:hypothetical protein